ncbi:hypothetical protein V7159_24700, partial [Priestia megaterium]
MDDDEIQSILNFVKDKDDIDIDFLEGTDSSNGFYANREKSLKAKKWYDQKKTLTGPAYLVGKNYSGAKNGLVFSPRLRNVFTHELGHAIDKARNPILYKSNTGGKLLQRSSLPIALSNGAVVSYLSSDENEDNELSKGTLEGFTSGAVSGGAIGGIGSLMVNRGENAANKYGREIISEVNDPEQARKFLNSFEPLRHAAKRTYNIHGQTLLKNSLINAGIGAIAGGSLANIAHMHRQDNDS